METSFVWLGLCMISVLFNGKKQLIPSCWEEITVKQYIRIITEWEPELDIADRDYFKLLNILCNGDHRYVRDSENEVTLIDIVGWVILQPFEFSKEIPLVLNFKGKLVDVPRETSALSIGQNIHLRREMEKRKTIQESIGIATAIFLQPLIDGKKFDMIRAKEIEKEILEMPVYLIYPVGFFLLNLVLKHGRDSVRIWSRVNFSLNRILKRLSPRWPGSTN